jgi:hypothetical protein
MSAGEEAAAALRASKAGNAAQQALVQESRELLTSFIRQEFGDQMRVSVAEGLAAFMSEANMERFWKKGFEVAQKESRKRLRDAAGDLVLGGVRGLAKWGSMALVLVAFAYYIGGFALAKTMWLAITKGSA